MRLFTLIFLSLVGVCSCQWQFFENKECTKPALNDATLRNYKGEINECVHVWNDGEPEFDKVTCNGNTWAHSWYKDKKCLENWDFDPAQGESANCTQFSGSLYLMVTCPSSSTKLSTQAIIGVVIGSISFVVILMLFIRRYRSSSTTKRR